MAFDTMAPRILPDKVNSPDCENDCMNGSMIQVSACDDQYIMRQMTGNTDEDIKLSGSLQYICMSDAFVVYFFETKCGT